MRRKLLSLAIMALFAGTVSAQCTPDPQYTTAGIYPDSAANLPTAYVGHAYDETITAVVPTDTLVDVGLGFPVTVTIVSIEVTSVNGLPAMFDNSCTPTDCVFPGGQSGCMNLYSTSNPTSGDIGLYPLDIYLTTTADAGLAGIITQDDTLDYYVLEIADSTGVGVGITTFEDQSFELRNAFPNPVKDEAKIQFIKGTQGTVEFTVTNLLGAVVEKRTIRAKRGVNDIYINTEEFPNGIYLYSLSSGNSVLTKRMIVNK